MIGFTFYAVIVGFVSLIFIIIGVVSYRSETPAKMNTGEPDIPPEKIRDLTAWNHKHGIMWIVFAVVFAAGMLLFNIILSHVNISIAVTILMAFLILDFLALNLYHTHLVRTYKLP